MKTVSLPDIIEALVASAKVSQESATLFIEALTSEICRQLSENGTADIPGLGSFRAVEIGDKKEVEFAPDTALATEINAPFSIFEPIEIADNISMESLDAQLESEASKPTQHFPKSESPEDSQRSETTEVSHKSETSDKSEQSEVPHPAPPAPPKIPTTPQIPIPPKSPSPQQLHRSHFPENYNTTHKSRHGSFIWFGPLLLLIGLLIGYYIGRGRLDFTANSVHINASQVEVHQQAVDEYEVDEVVDLSELPDTIWNENDSTAENFETTETSQNIPVEITDTIRANYYLTTMAQKYYGKKKFWVYIYLENADRIEDPDMIPANTVVVIPPAEKYNIKAGDPASEDDAERKALDILKKS